MSAPTEFRYRERQHTVKARLARSLGRSVLGFDPAPDDAWVDAFEASCRRGDPLAEAFVRSEGKGGLRASRRTLEAALAREQAPVSPELRALLDDVRAQPPWLDEAQLELGAKTFRRYGSAVFRFAGAITLAGYRESSVAKPLAMSGAYVGAGTRARFLETASFWIEISEPGGLLEGGKGWAAALHVRLLHASVRLRLENHPQWNERTHS